MIQKSFLVVWILTHLIQLKMKPWPLYSRVHPFSRNILGSVPSSSLKNKRCGGPVGIYPTMGSPVWAWPGWPWPWPGPQHPEGSSHPWPGCVLRSASVSYTLPSERWWRSAGPDASYWSTLTCRCSTASGSPRSDQGERGGGEKGEREWGRGDRE